MHRFFIKPDSIHGQKFSSSDKELCHQLSKVLKMRAGKKVILCDDTEREFEAEWTVVSRSECEAKILEKKAVSDISSQHPVHLFVTPLKNQNRYELILEKCTEIGVASFTPLITERTEVESLRKPERLERIIKEAAEQSGRTLLPTINPPVNFSDLLNSPPAGQNLIFSLHEKSQSLPSVETNESPVNLFIGPVGDFTEEELKKAIEQKFYSITLGSQVLRSETAAIVASSILLAG